MLLLVIILNHSHHQEMLYGGSKTEKEKKMYLQTLMYLLEKWFGLVMTVGIILIYGYNVHILLCFIKTVKKQRYTWLLVQFLLVSIGFVASYSYVFFKFLTDQPIYLATFSLIFIRPLIFIMGCNIASFITISLKTCEKGGTKWIQFKSGK